MKNLFKAIFISLVFLGGFVGIARAVETFTDVQSFYKATLTSSISSSATTINVSIAPYVNTGFLVIEPRTPNQEIVLMTSRSGTALTVVRGLSATSSSPVDAGYKRAHAAGSAVEMVDVHYYIKQLQNSKSFQYRGATTTAAELNGITGTSTNDLAYVTDAERFYRIVGGIWVKQGDNNETIGGTKTFSSQPQVPTPTASTSAANMGYVDTKIPLTYLDTDTLLVANSDAKIATQKATKAYIDNAVVAGGVIANNTTTGIQRVASSTQIASGFSSTTAFAIPSSLASSTASSTTIVVATKSSTGKIDPTFLNGSGESYTFNGTTTFNGTVNILGSSNLLIYGDGSDGNVTISSGTTTLTRDMYYNNLTVNGTGTLDTAGFNVFVRGLTTVDTSAGGGGIQRRGGNGGNGGNGSLDAGGTGGTAGTISTSPAKTAQALNGRDGGNGTTISSDGQAGNFGTTTSLNYVHSNGATGGTGGGGSGMLSRPGGAGGTGGVSSSDSIVKPRNIFSAMMPFMVTGDTTIARFNITPGSGSGGGGGGASDGGSNCGGGGGGGSGATGGFLFLSTNRLSITGTGAINANGGNGGNGGNGHTVGSATGGRGGGGAGGNGGVAVVSYISKTGTGTITANGGTGGTAGTGGGTANNGANGANGLVIEITN